MARKEFIKMCGLLGIVLPINTTHNSCSKEDITINQNEKVIIIGAGAGGLTAGHLLSQRGFAFEILEALDDYGGRMKRTKDFADYF